MTARPMPKCAAGSTVSVSSSGVPTADAEFRRTWWTYVLGDADGWQHSALTWLFDRWQRLNTEFYNRAMLAPHILLAEASNPRRLSGTGHTSGFGGRCQIRIRPVDYYLGAYRPDTRPVNTSGGICPHCQGNGRLSASEPTR